MRQSAVAVEREAPVTIFSGDDRAGTAAGRTESAAHPVGAITPAGAAPLMHMPAVPLYFVTDYITELGADLSTPHPDISLALSAAFRYVISNVTKDGRVAGRKPIGDTAMTNADRQRRWREAHGQATRADALRARIAELEAQLREALERQQQPARGIQGMQDRTRKGAAPEPMEAATMAPGLRKQFDTELRKARREIEAELRNNLSAEYDKYLGYLKEREARVNRILASHKGVITRKQFDMIRNCLHSDYNKFKNADEAFNTFLELEDVLVKPPEAVVNAPPLPATTAELLRNRREYVLKNSERGQRAAETRRKNREAKQAAAGDTEKSGGK